jgi:exportin-1
LFPFSFSLSSSRLFDLRPLLCASGSTAARHVAVRQMRAVKKEVLKLIQTFVNLAGESDKELIYKKLVPPLLDPVLDDYKRNVADARDAEVLYLFAAIISKLGQAMVPHVTRIFESVFEVTLDMITKNFEGNTPTLSLSSFRLGSLSYHFVSSFFFCSSSQITPSCVWLSSN